MASSLKIKTATKSTKTALENRFLVKLDHRTTILLHKQSLFKVWKKKFPDAKIIHFYSN
jgi:hypothetical protein